MSPRRQRANTTSSSRTGSKTKSRNEKLLEFGRAGRAVGRAFVSDPDAISAQLVSVIRRKACQVTVYYTDATGEVDWGYGSGGLLRGSKIANSPEEPATPATSRPTKKVKFEIFSSYEVTPVTAKHNLVVEDDENYLRTEMQFPETRPMIIDMPDGGCKMTDLLVVRPATDETHALHTEDDDFSFGKKVTTSEKTITKMPFLFQCAPPSFHLRVGHKIGIAVFRTFQIAHDDAEAPRSMAMEQFYGTVGQPCIYTGTVTEISANGKTFGHNINTYTGCSGAIVFLLDKDQPDNFDDSLHGLAVGIHTGGMDDNNNLGFILPQTSI